MPDYSKGKIYRLIDGRTLEDLYIGSTTQPLSYRKSGHKRDTKRKSDQPIYRKCNEIGWDNIKILLIEEYPCESREQLLAREGFWQKKIQQEGGNLYNVQTAGRSEEEAKKVWRETHGKEWRKQNKEKIYEYNKQRYETKKETINEARRKKYAENEEYKKKISLDRKKRVKCLLCDKEMSIQSFYRHRRDRPHQNKLKVKLEEDSEYNDTYQKVESQED